MSWPNHVQIWSFASMTPSQVARKHDFVAKVAGGCSSYDVIAPWPDLTRSNFFLPKIAQGLPRKVAQNPAVLRAAVFFCYPRKTSGGVAPPPIRARVNIRWRRSVVIIHDIQECPLSVRAEPKAELVSLWFSVKQWFSAHSTQLPMCYTQQWPLPHRWKCIDPMVGI